MTNKKIFIALVVILAISGHVSAHHKVKEELLKIS